MPVEIVRSYANYTPPVDAAAATRFLLRHTPRNCLVGLKRIVLTNASALSRDQRRQTNWADKRQYRLGEVRAVYHPPSQGQPAWIEVFVDNVLRGWPRWFLCCVPMIRHMVFAETVYHEIGHHIHWTIHPEYAEREAAANKWARRLTTYFARRRYWYLLPVALVLTILFRAVKEFAEKPRKPSTSG